MYDSRTAAIYDLLYADSDGQPLRDSRAEAHRILDIIASLHPTAKSLLDVGCGTGRHLAYMSDRLSIHGLDVNTEFLAVARDRCPTGVFHEGDMEELALDRRFDVVTCMFSSIAYVPTPDRLDRTVAGFARHLNHDGLLILEPWFTPDAFWDGHVVAHCVDRPDVKIAWMHRQERDGRMSRLDVHYLVATQDSVSHHSERHEYALFTDAEYRHAMEAAGLTVSHDAVGFGRGLYVGLLDRSLAP